MTVILTIGLGNDSSACLLKRQGDCAGSTVMTKTAGAGRGGTRVGGAMQSDP